jgi:hypothetical protein
MRRCEITNEWEHELRCHGGDGCDEGNGAKCSKRFRDTKSDPAGVSRGILKSAQSVQDHNVPVNQTSHRTKGLLFNKSPRGHKNNSPAA